MFDLKQQQASFAAHLRNPILNPAPANNEERRLAIYRQLFFNNIRQFLANAFPVLRSLYIDEAWDELIRDFYTKHKAQTPYFVEISEEFLAWLDNADLAIHQQFPFARELAHYEWVELALDVADSKASLLVSAELDVLAAQLMLSDLAWPLLYAWPVHLIGKDFQPQAASEIPHCLIVYRNAADKVCFLESNTTTFRLLEIIKEQPEQTSLQALQQLVTEMPQANPYAIINFGTETLAQLLQLGILSLRA